MKNLYSFCRPCLSFFLKTCFIGCCVVTLMLPASVFSQQVIKVPLVTISGSKSSYQDMHTIQPVKDLSDFKGIPVNMDTNWCIKVFNFNKAQARYNDFLTKTKPYSDYQRFVNYYEEDTTFIIKKILKGNSVPMYISLNPNGTKTVIVDANNNRDFSDDSVITVNLADSVQKLQEITVRIEYFDGKQVKEAHIPIIINAYHGLHDYANPIEEKLDMIVYLASTKTGEIISGTKKFKVEINNENYGLIGKIGRKINVREIKTDITEGIVNKYTNAETINIDNYLYKVKSITDTLVLEKIGYNYLVE